jgi:hypothetical protein
MARALKMKSPKYVSKVLAQPMHGDGNLNESRDSAVSGMLTPSSVVHEDLTCTSVPHVFQTTKFKQDQPPKHVPWYHEYNCRTTQCHQPVERRNSTTWHQLERGEAGTSPDRQSENHDYLMPWCTERTPAVKTLPGRTNVLIVRTWEGHHMVTGEERLFKLKELLCYTSSSPLSLINQIKLNQSLNQSTKRRNEQWGGDPSHIFNILRINPII